MLLYPYRPKHASGLYIQTGLPWGWYALFFQGIVLTQHFPRRTKIEGLSEIGINVGTVRRFRGQRGKEDTTVHDIDNTESTTRWPV